jgi:hypothetical protein
MSTKKVASKKSATKKVTPISTKTSPLADAAKKVAASTSKKLAQTSKHSHKPKLVPKPTILQEKVTKQGLLDEASCGPLIQGEPLLRYFAVRDVLDMVEMNLITKDEGRDLLNLPERAKQEPAPVEVDYDALTLTGKTQGDVFVVTLEGNLVKLPSIKYLSGDSKELHFAISAEETVTDPFTIGAVVPVKRWNYIDDVSNSENGPDEVVEPVVNQ